ncbi:MAG: MFS transporter [Armatimonadota bacterium]
MVVNDPKKQKWIAVSVAFAALMCSLDIYIVNISLPTISHYFNCGLSKVSLIILSYLLVVTSTMLIFGKLGDKIGLRKVFVWGYFFFVLGSFLCGLSVSINMLIAARALQGIGGAMMYTTAFAIIPKFIPKSLTGWAFGITGTAAGVGTAIGAPLGGFITNYFSWQWIFLINVPVGIIAILVARAVIPHEAVEDKKEKFTFDVPGAVLSFLFLVTLVCALNMGQEKGWGSTLIVSLFVSSALFFILFLIRQKREKDPLIDLGIFKDLSFVNANLANFMVFMLMAGANFLLPFYLEILKGLDASKAGLVFMIFSVMYTITAPIAGRLSDSIAPRFLCIAATASAVLCTIMFTFTMQVPGLLAVIIYLTWIGISLGVFIAPNSSLVMNLAPYDKQGSASAVFRTITNLGLMLGVCVFESVFSQKTGIAESSLASSAVSNDMLISGFRGAFIVGICVCVLALVFSILVKKIPLDKYRKEQEEEVFI